MKIARIYRLAYNVLFDLKYGRFLGGKKKTPYSLNGANDTANSDYRAMSLIFKGKIKSDDVLVDVGCGKGRVLNFWISNFPKNQIVGIELDAEIAAKTAKRLRKYNNVNILSGSVLELIPDNATIFYLFNPFNSSVMDMFKQSLIEKFFAKDKGWIHSFSIIYYNPVCANSFLEDDRFSCVKIEMPDGYHKVLFIKQSKI